jgi:protein required for attachment to host cells
MLLFRNKGDRTVPNLEAETVKLQDNPYDRDQSTDVSGRAPSITGGQATMGKTDYHEQEEMRFAIEATDLLKRRALANDFEKLIIVAPPTALGEMRKHYHKEVQSRLVGEIAKDLANHPVPEIERIIAQS